MYDEFIPYLISAVKELSAENINLKNENSALKTQWEENKIKMDDILARLAKLET